jgi:hypothetical protein
MMRVSISEYQLIFSCRWLLAACLCLFMQLATAATDPLPSWAEGESKQSIKDFVQQVTTPDGSDFVAPDERIAVFDNDGTLWSEKPAYFQLLSLPSATPTVICRCCSGQRPGRARASGSSSITPTPGANGPTIETPTTANSTRHWVRQPLGDGRWWI